MQLNYDFRKSIRGGALAQDSLLRRRDWARQFPKIPRKSKKFFDNFCKFWLEENFGDESQPWGHLKFGCHFCQFKQESCKILKILKFVLLPFYSNFSENFRIWVKNPKFEILNPSKFWIFWIKIWNFDHANWYFSIPAFAQNKIRQIFTKNQNSATVVYHNFDDLSKIRIFQNFPKFVANIG